MRLSRSRLAVRKYRSVEAAHALVEKVLDFVFVDILGFRVLQVHAVELVLLSVILCSRWALSLSRHRSTRDLVALKPEFHQAMSRCLALNCS